jgi:5-bromo-4-chloroindolyl phosphate hydrolysis protein
VIALTFLQSINQTFVLEKYVNAFVMVIPAIFVMVPLPIWSIHRRIQQAKIELLTQIDSNIIGASKALKGEDLHRLNSLMQRRDDIQKMRDWPVDFSISTKFFLYVFIVPMAWAGVALMEILLDTVLRI